MEAVNQPATTSRVGRILHVCQNAGMEILAQLCQVQSIGQYDLI
jgi:hypothetical protein